MLPAWSQPVSSVILILQRCRCSLLEVTPTVAIDKEQLRERFITLGQAVARQLQDNGHRVDLFDPMTGWPLLSLAGSLVLDDVAVVHALLGYPILTRGGCSVVLHPTWGSALYPATIVSSAEPDVVQSVVAPVIANASLTPTTAHLPVGPVRKGSQEA